MIKSFRRSKRSSNSSSTSSPKHISRVSSTSHTEVDFVANSPTKVIKALYDYKPQGPRELQFEKGDFFHVLSDESSELDEQGWYEATNPMTNQRGMVPKSYFEAFNRSMHASARGNDIDQSNPIFAKIQQQQELQNIQQRTIQNLSQHGGHPARENRTLYAVTVYEFRAEREDELDIVPGEHLVICAHHDYEWFIAKPINRLGGPGLVPASYVKIVDKYNPQAQMDDGADDMVALITKYKIPTVEEWKESTANYQASTSAAVNTSNNISSYYIESASVDSYHLTEDEEKERYQYAITAHTSTGKTRVLYRFYEEFFNLQVKVLEQNPVEAGKRDQKRTIPVVPGPVYQVSENISSLRRERFDEYLRALIALPVHISRSDAVLEFLEVHDNGYDREYSDKGRQSKPISQQSGYQQDRLSQYSSMQPYATRNRSSNTPSSDSNTNKRGSSPGLLASLAHQPSVDSTKQSKVKVKFYYEDDIFVLLLPKNLKIEDLKTKLAKRLELQGQGETDPSKLVFLFLKSTYEGFMDQHHIAGSVLTEEQRELLFREEIKDDTRFHEVLHEKCKIVILSG